MQAASLIKPPPEIIAIIRKWRRMVEGEAYDKIQVERDSAYVGRVWLRDVARIDAWLAEIENTEGSNASAT